MKLKNIALYSVLTMLIWSCKDDDDVNSSTFTLQTLSQTALENEAEIQRFLQTHFYELDGANIVFDTIAGANASKTPLSQVVSSTVISITPKERGLLDEDNTAVDHTLYYLVAKEGPDSNPFATIADSTYLRYEGLRLDGTVFEARTGEPVWFDLLGNPFLGTGRVVIGFAEGIAKFRPGGAITENGDGTFNVENPSLGFIIIPSGLGYFAGAVPGKAYAPMIFKLDIIRSINADHDNDGVTSIQEGVSRVNSNLDQDTDDDNISDYLDTDDDGDTILTRDEIKVDSEGNFVSFLYTDEDEIPDHLDAK